MPEPIDRLSHAVSEAERDRCCMEWNATRAEYPQDKCVHELFEEQVRRRRMRWRWCMRRALSYAELNARANRLAHYLRELGVGPESGWRSVWSASLEMVVGLLGVLKAAGHTCRWIPAIRPSDWSTCWRIAAAMAGADAA